MSVKTPHTLLHLLPNFGPPMFSVPRGIKTRVGFFKETQKVQATNSKTIGLGWTEKRFFNRDD